MVAFSRTLAHFSRLAVALGLVACAGGQTGQEGYSGGPCVIEETTEQDAAALLARYAGTYRAPVARSESDDRCPAEGYTTVEVTVTGAVSEEELEDKPCGARFIPVSVEVSTEDGEPSTSFEGWLSEDGQITGGPYRLTLSTTSNVVVSLYGFGLRTFEACCLEPPPEELVSGLELGTTDLLTLYFCGDVDCMTERSTELTFSLTTSAAAKPCDTLEATFELRTASGDLAASGDGSMEYSFITCNGAGRPCLDIEYVGAGSVIDQQLFLSNSDFPDELGALDLTFWGKSRGGQLEGGSLLMEVLGDPIGIAMNTRAP